MRSYNYKKNLDVARKLMRGEGCLGWIVKAFFGRQQMSVFRQAFNKVDSQLMNQKKNKHVIKSGKPAKAIVLDIKDTYMRMWKDPVVILRLKVRTGSGYEFETTIQTRVSKINIPRVNDEINVKYNPFNTNEVAIVQ
ncbi:hypothetical protein ACFL56_02710 [Candidatus Margulisiibacteriota bacterium]